MGQKVHPIGFRLGVVKGWQSRWFAEKEYKNIYAEDVKIRKLILSNKDFSNAGISRIEIERTAADQVTVFIHTAKPGIVIGRSGEKVEKLKNALQVATKKRLVKVDIKEIRNPELDAILVSQSIAEQLEKRVSFRRAMKQAVQKSIRANAKGIKVIVAGRLGGAEIARTEKEVEGKVPLHTLRADIDYGQAEAHTTYGLIGIKVWIYRGEILPTKRREPGEPDTTSLQPAYVTREGGQRNDRRGGGPQRGGERGPRPPFRGGDRPQGGGQRFGGERPRTQQGDRPMGGGERPVRAPRPPIQGQQGQGQGGPRPPRPQQGERAPRTPREQQQPRNQAPDTAPAPEAQNQNPESSATQSE